MWKVGCRKGLLLRSAIGVKQEALGGFLAPPGCALPFGMQVPTQFIFIY